MYHLISSFTHLLSVIYDLESLRSVIDGHSKANNSVRDLFTALRRDMLPITWKRGSTIQHLSPSSWIDDLARRMEQIRVLIQAAPETYHKIPVWLGGLYSPEVSESCLYLCCVVSVIGPFM